MLRPQYLPCILLLCILLCNCGASASRKTEASETEQLSFPSFSADSAYVFIERQVAFGPRVPNTTAHKRCAAYLSKELKRFGAEVFEQAAELKAFDGTKLQAVNIIGSFNPTQSKRILLCAHWDSRPWCDHDPEPQNRKQAVSGANDGASGVGVLLEIARLIGKQPPSVGIDMIFFDAEDYGAPQDAKTDMQDSWCLGSQYWAKHPHRNGYRASYGILLDMVAAPGATFYREQISEYFAPNIVEKVWKEAQRLGFGHYFVNKKGGAITDDHLYVNRISGIPCIDIIQFDPQSQSGFGHYWHTVNDTMENIDKATLHAVGSTLIHVLYKE